MIEEKNDLMKNIAGNESNNLRKYLILGGGVFVLFVVGIVIAKFMFSSPKQNNDTKVILPTDIKQENKDTKLFNDIPIENETTDFQKPEIEKEPKVVETPKVEPKKQELIVQKEEIKTPVKPVKKEEPKKQAVAEQAKIEKKVEPKKTKIVRNYYIQVAAVTRGNPSTKFLNLIKKNGFNYKIEKVNIKGMQVKRVLIGGYTYKEVKNALPKVRAKISSSAFIKRLK